MASDVQKTVRMTFNQLLLAFAIALAGIGYAAAEDTSRNALFDALKKAPSEQEARIIEKDIWESWIDAAPVPQLRLKLKDAMRLREQYDFQGAKDLLDEVVAEAPGYAEGWNQRAFVLFLQGNYEESLIDINRTLELEPRHFGALSGKAMILMTMGRVKLGQDTLREAVEIHPYLRERSMLIEPKGTDL